MSTFFRYALAILALLSPQVASAHSPIKGIGTFFNGVLHPLLVPSQLLLILALGLWFGQNQPKNLVKAVLLFLSACIAGLLIAGFQPLSQNNTILLFLLGGTVLIGLLTVSAFRLPQPWFILPGLLAGLLLGLDSTPEYLSAKARVMTLFGSGVGIYFTLLYAMAFSETLSNKTWQNLGVRVIASWISASAIIVLAFHFSPAFTQ